jgi:hypothetical protein
LGVSSLTGNYGITLPPAAPVNAGHLNVFTGGSSNWVTGRSSFDSGTTQQTISNVTNTAVNFGVTGYNVGAIITPSAGNSVFTNTSGSTITVMVIYSVYWNQPGGTQDTYLSNYIQINGTGTYFANTGQGSWSINSNGISTNASDIFSLNNNDAFSVYAYQDNISNVTIGNSSGSSGHPNNFMRIWQLA